MSDNESKPVAADFDLDAWIDGTCGITGMARLIQRGDLLAKVDRLEAELQAAKRAGIAERGLADRSVETIKAEIDQVYEQIWDSMLWVKVQDRTLARREAIAERLKKQGVTDNDTIGLHLIADSIVGVETADGRQIPLPEGGFPPEKLRAIRDRAGDAALIELNRVFMEVTAEAPAVQAPLSRASSAPRAGSTSPRRSARRGSGGSRQG